MKKGVIILVFIVFGSAGCASLDWQQKLQTQYFDIDGKPAGLSGSWPCIRQAMRETGRNILLEDCFGDRRCQQLTETCMKEKGYFEAKAIETTKERMNLYRMAYEAGWIKPGMTRIEVIDLIGAPQIVTFQLIPPRKIWIYCRSATKTTFIGFNFVLQIIWYEDKVESVERVFKI